MAVRPPNTATQEDPLSSTFSTDLAGLEEVYRLLEDTQRVFGMYVS